MLARKFEIKRLVKGVACLALISISFQPSLATTAEAVNFVSAAIENRGVVVFSGNLEILSEIGSFEIYKAGNGPRAQMLTGPSLQEHIRGPLNGPFSMEKTGQGREPSYKFNLHWHEPNTLRVSVEYQSTVNWPTGVEFCIGKLASGLFAGSTLTGSAQTLRLPLTPRTISDRHLLKNQSSLTINSSFIDISVVPNDGDISVADFRSVPWDKRRSFYLFSNRKLVLPGQKVSFSYNLIFSKPSLTASAQYGRTTIPLALPVKEDSETFFKPSSNHNPDLPVRGVLTELLQPAQKNISVFKGYVRAIAKAHGNTLVLYHLPEHVRLLQRGKVGSKWWSREELREIASYARSFGIDVIPGMTSKFKPNEFPLLSSGEQNGFYNTFDPNAYRELFTLYQVLLDIYKPKALLIGHDEIRAVGKGKPEGWSDARTLASDVKKVSGWLRGKGVTTLIFGDMFLDRKRWPNLFTANSNNPRYASTDTHEALDKLPKDIVILDWQYKDSADYPTIEYFREKGFSVWGVSWYDAHAAVSLVKSLIRYKGNGILASDWGIWRTLSPAATNLYAIKAGYDSSIQVRSDGEDAVIALADEMRVNAVTKSRSGFSPIGIEKIANGTTQDSFYGDGKGFVDLGSAFDLRALPAGQHLFSGVLFRTLPFDSDEKPNCLIVTGPQSVTIPMGGGNFSTLAFLQTMRQIRPQVVPRKIGAYEIVYADGKRVHIPLIEGYNITDVRSAAGIRKNPWGFSTGIDILSGSLLGWRGVSLSGMHMNLQVMLWVNPEPRKAIRKIRLLPMKGTTVVLVAMSAKS